MKLAAIMISVAVLMVGGALTQEIQLSGGDVAGSKNYSHNSGHAKYSDCLHVVVGLEGGAWAVFHVRNVCKVLVQTIFLGVAFFNTKRNTANGEKVLTINHLPKGQWADVSVPLPYQANAVEVVRVHGED